ncbi:methyltransferase family protein [Promicromonospora sp. AC04]|uniref:class I SAM-dependent methyltransferase n=1 Tax=Promicromonospora sp. AC04 TaxID=2135723 RepID=UPI000D3BD2CD|nr:class I SAM-dependent methyltransferase [Promicromonospora sp. AC04]PUB28688.1 methyltransferase family protein [Promicromonospora sp. AC04]
MNSTTVRILDHRTPEEREREFLPGMGKPWLLPFYDVFSRFSGVRPLHDRAAALAGIAPGEIVLDVGCGTASLSLAVLRAQPAARVTGLDPDVAALRVAARKASRRRVPLTLVQGFADRLPTGDGSLDHIVSSLALHHVPDEARIRFGQEAFRALRPGGKVTIVDFGSADGADGATGTDGATGATGADGATGGAHGAGQAGGEGHQHGRGRTRGPGSRGGYGRVRGHGGAGEHGGAGRGHSAVAANPHTARNLEGGLLRLFTDAGFTDAREIAHVEHRYGPITFVQATRA